jgi:hypothetical protein
MENPTSFILTFLFFILTLATMYLAVISTGGDRILYAVMSLVWVVCTNVNLLQWIVDNEVMENDF